MSMFGGIKDKVGDMSLKTKIVEREKPDFVDKIVKLENEKTLLSTYLSKTSAALEEEPGNDTLAQLKTKYAADLERTESELEALHAKAETLKEKTVTELATLETEKKIQDETLREVEVMNSKGLLREEDYMAQKKKVSGAVAQYEKKIEKAHKVLAYLAEINH